MSDKQFRSSAAGTSVRRYVDHELRYMACAFWVGPLLIVLGVLTVSRSDILWGLSAIPLGLGLQAVLPAYTVSELAPDHLVLRNGVRRLHVTPESLVSVKGLFEGKWNAHLSVRTRRHIYTELRVWKFDNPEQLAQTLLRIGQAAGPGVARPSAVRILHQALGQATS